MKLAALAQPTEISVLLVEDSPGDAAAISKAMIYGESLYYFRITHRESLQDGLDALSKFPADVILLDLNLPDAKGTQTIDDVHRSFPELPIVVISGYSDMDVVHRALKSGVQEFLIKGECSGQVIRQSIYQAMVRKKIEQAYERGDRL